MSDYARLKQLARSLPRKGWSVGGATPSPHAGMYPAVHHEEADPTYCQSYEMAEYIAECHPDMILYLIARAEAADKYEGSG